MGANGKKHHLPACTESSAAENKVEGETVAVYLQVQSGIIVFELVLLFCLGQPKIAAAAFSSPRALFTLMRGQIYLLVCLCTKIYPANISAAAVLSAVRENANTAPIHRHTPAQWYFL